MPITVAAFGHEGIEVTYDDRLWMARSKAVLAPLWRQVKPPGKPYRVRWLTLYAWLLRAHRWLWVRGFRL